MLKRPVPINNSGISTTGEGVAGRTVRAVSTSVDQTTAVGLNVTTTTTTTIDELDASPVSVILTCAISRPGVPGLTAGYWCGFSAALLRRLFGGSFFASRALH